MINDDPFLGQFIFEHPTAVGQLSGRFGAANPEGGAEGLCPFPAGAVEFLK